MVENQVCILNAALVNSPVQTFAIVITKNNPTRQKFVLGPNLEERIVEERIEEFEPYSRVVYVKAVNEMAAQIMLFDHMRDKNIDWKDLQDGMLLQ